MSEKRFNLAFYDNYDGTFSIQDTLYLKENKHLHSLDEIVDLLNEQHEDILFKIGLIDSLQEAIGELKDDLNSLYNEIEQLKEERDYYKRELQKDLVCQAIIDGRERITECNRFKLEDIGFVRDNGTLIGMKKIVECLNTLHEENELLQKTLDDTVELLNKKNILQLEEDLQYYKSKCASLEEGLFRGDREVSRLKKENKKLADALTVYSQLKNIKGDVE